MTLSTFENDVRDKIVAEYNKLSDEGRDTIMKELGWARAHVWVDLAIVFGIGLVIGFCI